MPTSRAKRRRKKQSEDLPPVVSLNAFLVRHRRSLSFLILFSLPLSADCNIDHQGNLMDYGRPILHLSLFFASIHGSAGQDDYIGTTVLSY